MVVGTLAIVSSTPSCGRQGIWVHHVCDQQQSFGATVDLMLREALTIGAHVKVASIASYDGCVSNVFIYFIAAGITRQTPTRAFDGGYWRNGWWWLMGGTYGVRSNLYPPFLARTAIILLQPPPHTSSIEPLSHIQQWRKANILSNHHNWAILIGKCFRHQFHRSLQRQMFDNHPLQPTAPR